MRYNQGVSPQEQDEHLAHLVLDARRTRKKIACLASKCRQLREVLYPILTSSESPWGVNLDSIKNSYAEIADVDIGDLIQEIKDSMEHHRVVEKEIIAIEGSVAPT